MNKEQWMWMRASVALVAAAAAAMKHTPVLPQPIASR
jgi:hypothetical protein